MSHITQVQLTVNDLDAVEEGLQALDAGLELRRGKKTYKSYYGQRSCEHAIGVKGDPGGYEIGLVQEPGKKGLSVIYDTWGPGAEITRRIGSGGDRLKHEYAVAVATKAVKKTLGRQGWTVQRQVLDGGRSRLVARKR